MNIFIYRFSGNRKRYQIEKDIKYSWNWKSYWILIDVSVYTFIYGIFVFSMKNSLKVTIGKTMNKSYILYLLLTKISAKN